MPQCYPIPIRPKAAHISSTSITESGEGMEEAGSVGSAAPRLPDGTGWD